MATNKDIIERLNCIEQNVSTGQLDVYSRDVSQLIGITGDEDFNDGQVWQSAFKNWVYEPDIPSSVSGVAPPIIASGVTVNGSFHADTASGVFEHFIDYQNGRVVFLSPISTSSTVQAEFGYKEVTVDFADKFDNERLDLLTETAFKDNPQQADVQQYPKKENRTLPAVWIELLSRENSGYELGSSAAVSDFLGMFHVWARDTYMRDIIEDILNDAHREIILGINFNTAPFALLSKGRKNAAWPGYSVLADVHSPHFWRRIYMDDIKSEKVDSLFEVERTMFRFQIRTYPNF